MGIIHLDTKRHTLKFSTHGTVESPNGEYVMFEDYQALWDELNALKIELSVTKAQGEELCQYTDKIQDDWDDLLEDIEMHGMHDFEPYVSSKIKFSEMIANQPEIFLAYHAKLLARPFPCFKCGADLNSQTRNVLEDGIICTNCGLTSTICGPNANKIKDISSDMSSFKFEADK